MIFIILTIGIYSIKCGDESRLTGNQKKYCEQNDLDLHLCIYYQSVLRFVTFPITCRLENVEVEYGDEKVTLYLPFSKI